MANLLAIPGFEHLRVTTVVLSQLVSKGSELGCLALQKVQRFQQLALESPLDACSPRIPLSLVACFNMHIPVSHNALDVRPSPPGCWRTGVSKRD